jgi:AraC-like DNA-binding protein
MNEEIYRYRLLKEGSPRPLFRRMMPPPDLAPHIVSIVTYEEDGTPLILSGEFAPLVVPFIISFGEPFEIGLGRPPRAGETFSSFTSGLFPGFVLINSTGRSKCIQVDFTPTGARRFLGFPMSEITGVLVEFCDLGDPQLQALRRRLADITDWEHRIALLLSFIRMRLAAGSGVTPQIEAAWQSIARKAGAIRIGRLADQLGWSRKHLVSRFREEIGLPPKTVARMMRFNRAMSMAGNPSSWADIALVCGYADQAHLIREFVEFAGRSPTEWQRTLTGNIPSRS